MKRFLALLIGVLAFVPASSLAAEPSVTIELPFDKAVLSTKSAMVIYKVPPGFSPVVLRGEKEQFKEGYKVPGDDADLVHLLLPLNEGLNKFTWVDPSNEQRIKSLSIYRIPASSTRKVMDTAAKTFIFHVPELEKNCSGCHELSPDLETVDRKLPTGVLCTSCHRDIISGEEVHRPAGGFTCLYCHDPKYAPSRFTVNDGEKQSCGTCHDDYIAKEITSKQFIHGPLAVDRCNTCHTPHAGFKKLLEQEQIKDLCARCHYETVNQNMTEGLHADNPCNACHVSHGANNPGFLKKDAVEEMCLECHEHVREGEHAEMHNHPVSYKADAARKIRPMNCISCHTVHGRKDITTRNIFENSQEQKKFCERCHYD